MSSTADNLIAHINAKNTKEIIFKKFPLEESEKTDNVVQRIATALEQNNQYFRIDLEEHYFKTKSQYKKILSIIFKKVNLRYLYLYTAEILPDELTMLSQSQIAELYLGGDSRNPSKDDFVVQELSKMKKLTHLLFRGEVTDLGAKALSENKSLIYLSLPYSTITMKGLITLIKTNQFEDLYVESEAIRNETNLKEFEEAMNQNTSLERFSQNPKCNSIQLCLHRNIMAKQSADKITVVTNYKNQKIMTRDRGYELSEKIRNAFQEKSGSELRQVLDQLGYIPNSYLEFHEENPELNCKIACEMVKEAAQIIEAYYDAIDPNLIDYEGKTALIISAKVYSADKVLKTILKYLRNKIEDINAKDNSGCTALHYVCAYGKTDLALLLLEHGADINAEDKQRRTPLDYANMNNIEVTTILRSIHIDSVRDVNAPCDDLGMAVCRIECLDNTLVTLENMQKINTYILSEQYITDAKNSYYAESVRKHWIEKYENLKNSLAGKSMISVIMESKPKLREILLEKGGVSYVDPQYQAYTKMTMLLNVYQKSLKETETILEEASELQVKLGLKQQGSMVFNH